MAEFNTYYYNAQLRKVIVQFMAVFASMQVQVGWKDDREPRLIYVPIKNASSSRIVADVFSENTQNKPIRLPIMAAALKNITMSPESRHGVGSVTRTSFIPAGGVVPTDVTVAETRMPVPYIGNFELSIWTSNLGQQYQILEQILTIFNPTLDLQTGTDPLDPTRITTLELIAINMEDEPPGTERRTIRTTLQFDVKLYLAINAKVHNRIVHDIFVRVAAVANATNLQSSQDVIASMEQSGIDYEHWFDVDDLNFPQ